MPKSSKNKHETRRANRDRRQRLEDLRKQQKAAERRKNFLFAGSAIAVAIVLIAAAVIPAYLHDRAEGKKDDPGYQAKPTSAEKAAGCTGVHNDELSPAGDHIAEPIDYRTKKYGDDANGADPIPPTGGPHNPLPLGDQDRFLPLSQQPRVERAVHNLEHGYVVAYYDSKLPEADVAKLEKLATDATLGELLILGWTDGDLPGGKHFVLTSWARTDRCGSVSDQVVKEFYADNVNKLAPEVGSGPGPDACPAEILPIDAKCTPFGSTPSVSSSPKATSSPKKE